MKPKKTLKKTEKTIDYASITIPEPKTKGNPEKGILGDHTNYTCKQRRAEMLKTILSQGHTYLPVTFLSKLYGVAPSMITQDKDALCEYIPRVYLKPDKIKSEAIAAKQKALRGAIKDGRWRDADTISSSILQMCFDLGLITKSAEKLQVEGRLENVIDGPSLVEGFRLYQRKLKERKEK